MIRIIEILLISLFCMAGSIEASQYNLRLQSVESRAPNIPDSGSLQVQYDAGDDDDRIQTTDDADSPLIRVRRQNFPPFDRRRYPDLPRQRPLEKAPRRRPLPEPRRIPRPNNRRPNPNHRRL